MPNHVTNKIIFDAAESERVFAAICPSGLFDFDALIPRQIQTYIGDISSEDEKDFPKKLMLMKASCVRETISQIEASTDSPELTRLE